MESVVDRANQMAGTQLTKMRWALGGDTPLMILIESGLSRTFAPKPQPSST